MRKEVKVLRQEREILRKARRPFSPEKTGSGETVQAHRSKEKADYSISLLCRVLCRSSLGVVSTIGRIVRPPRGIEKTQRLPVGSHRSMSVAQRNLRLPTGAPRRTPSPGRRSTLQQETSGLADAKSWYTRLLACKEERHYYPRRK